MTKTVFKILSHADTDGAIAALLIKAHLVERFGNDLSIQIEPMNHGSAGGGTWSSKELKAPFAILDFTLDPSALLPRTYEPMKSLPSSLSELKCYWIDHHATGAGLPFLTQENLHLYLPQHLVAVWDTEAKSTPGLMRKHYQRLGISPDVLKRYEQLIDWAEIIDGALFESAAAALNASDPIVQLDFLFSSKHPGLNSARFYQMAIDDLLKQNGEFPLVILEHDPLYRAVIEYETRLNLRRRQAYESVIADADSGRIAVCDFRQHPELWRGLSRFVPYSLKPSCHFAIHITPLGGRDSTYAITCGQNPWNPPRSLPSLGEYFAEHFAGGGHRFVAGGSMSADDSSSLDELISFLSEAQGSDSSQCF